jgi:hypothetical protein
MKDKKITQRKEIAKRKQNTKERNSKSKEE